MSQFYVAGTDKNLDIDKARGIFARYPVKFAYVHGSFVEGGMSPMSDVDIAIVVDETVKKDKYLTLELELGTELELEKVVEEKEADVRIINEAPLAFKFHVIKDGRLMYDTDDDARCEFEEYTMGMYCDFQEHLKKEEYLCQQK
ncbi:MAG: nucleotidyltransferase domain-containing protein [bacterium]|nr:nucleotidyltransferase domain-containing protein [bacterium]